MGSSDESVRFVGRVTPGMIPSKPLQEGRALSPQVLLVAGGGASGGWRQPSAI
ncbi:UNVERIFIED_CONTAM: hypothetical protein Sradi_0646800 [Sesamum radiatum]|uniref:Uncharacterized protein n=1 Tax=Sesamum radiatum TaxID=300843 RepID=A0AAW2VLT3_SESRA